MGVVIEKEADVICVYGTNILEVLYGEDSF
jgi:hypothetical protein